MNVACLNASRRALFDCRPSHTGPRRNRLTLAVACLAALGLDGLVLATPAHAVDKFKVTNVECDMFWLWKHTPVLHYAISDERRHDYDHNPDPAYFREAAARTAEYCDRTASRKQQPLGPPQRIKGVWFQSDDGQFKALFDLDNDWVDMGANFANRIGDRFAADQRDAAAQAAQLEAIRTREAREAEVKAAEQKAQQERLAADRARVEAAQKVEQDKVAAETAREGAFFADRALQVARLGAEVTPAAFADVANVRTNPFHYKRLGLAVVLTQFQRMVTDRVALFGTDLAPIFVHIADVDRFTRAGEPVVLAFKVTERGEVERSYGSLPEVLVSALKAEPIFGDYVGSYSCPGGDCARLFDTAPPT